jgi:hypothetical protein
MNTFKQAKTIVPWIHTKVHVQEDFPLPSAIQSIRGAAAAAAAAAIWTLFAILYLFLCTYDLSGIQFFLA